MRAPRQHASSVSIDKQALSSSITIEFPSSTSTTQPLVQTSPSRGNCQLLDCHKPRRPKERQREKFRERERERDYCSFLNFDKPTLSSIKTHKYPGNCPSPEFEPFSQLPPSPRAPAPEERCDLRALFSHARTALHVAVREESVTESTLSVWASNYNIN